MTKSRLEAFSDGVLAIVITIMVLELKVPHEATFEALLKLWPIFLSYLLSFLFVAIYWVNHHHLLHTVKSVNSGILWSNMGVLFTLSLVPFTTGWMGENHFASSPVALYGINFLLCAVSAGILNWIILSRKLVDAHIFHELERQHNKVLITLAMNIAGIAIAFFYPLISCVLYAGITITWIIPNKNIEKALKNGVDNPAKSGDNPML